MDIMEHHATAIEYLRHHVWLKERQARERLSTSGTPEEHEDNFRIAEQLQKDVQSLLESVAILERSKHG